MLQPETPVQLGSATNREAALNAPSRTPGPTAPHLNVIDGSTSTLSSSCPAHGCAAHPAALRPTSLLTHAATRAPGPVQAFRVKVPMQGSASWQAAKPAKPEVAVQVGGWGQDAASVSLPGSRVTL